MKNIYILIGATIGLFVGGLIGAITGAVIGWIFSGWDNLIANIGTNEGSSSWKIVFTRALIVLAVGALISIVIGNR